MLGYIKKKSTLLFTIFYIFIIIGIILPPVLYLDAEFKTNPIIVIISLLMITLVFITFLYGWLGLISASSIMLFFIKMTMTLKFLEVKFDWIFSLAFLIGIILAINNCLLLLEKTRLNLKNDWSLQKAYQTAKDNAFIINIDKNIVVFALATIVFLVNNGIISTIGSIFVVSATLSFVFITLINPNLLKLFINLSFAKKAKFVFGVTSKVNFKTRNNTMRIIWWFKYIVLGILMIGIILAIIFVSVDASGVALFQSSSVIDIGDSKIITNGLISIAISLALMFVYITIRYRWSFALSTIFTLTIDLLVLISFFIIARLVMDSLFIASLLILPIISVSFSVNIFRDLQDRIETHVQKIDKDHLARKITQSIQKTKLRVMITFLLVSVSFATFLITSQENVFNHSALLAFCIAFASSKFMAPIMWSKFEIYRLKRVEKRVANNFWKTIGNEEQVIHGINNYNP